MWKLNDFAQIATVDIRFHRYYEEACPALLDHPLFIVPLFRERGEGKADKLYRGLKDIECYKFLKTLKIFRKNKIFPR